MDTDLPSFPAGRQLLLDDFVVESSTLTRHFHRPTLHPDCPVLAPATAMELDSITPMACPFDDGVFFDEERGQFMMWYHAGYGDGTALALSDDGVHWKRPALDIDGSNRVVPPRDTRRYRRDSATVWLDAEQLGGPHRFKMFVNHRDDTPSEQRVSADGVHWSDPLPVGDCGDNTCFYRDPFRKQWVFSVRSYFTPCPERRHLRGRSRRLTEDFLAGPSSWPQLPEGQRKVPQDPNPWLAAEDDDDRDGAFHLEPQLYKFNAVAYEGLLIGLFAMYKGPEYKLAKRGGLPKIVDLHLGWSRDGWSWARRKQERFIECSRTPGSWNYAYLHAAGGLFLVVGDRLYFYFAGFSGHPPAPHRWGTGSTGLAILRRDGFASLAAGGREEALTTKAMKLDRPYLFVNTDAARGELRAAVVDDSGQAFAGFGAEDCLPVRRDSTRQRIVWRNAQDLGPLLERRARLRFSLRDAHLFSFWLAADPGGASGGYGAGGGPGFKGGRDV